MKPRTHVESVIMTRGVHIVLELLLMMTVVTSEHVHCTPLCNSHTHARAHVERQFLCQIPSSPEEQLDRGSRLGEILAKTSFNLPQCGVAAIDQVPTKGRTPKTPVKCKDRAPRENIYVSPSSSSIYHYKWSKIKTYANIDQPDINSLSYSACLREIFAASSRNNIVVSFPLPDGGKKIVKENVFAADIVVEDHNQWLFLAQNKPSAIAVSNFDGSSFRIIKSVQGDPTSLDVDPKQERIYFCKSGKVLVQMDYSGASYKDLKHGSIHSVTLHQVTGLLYITLDDYYIHRYSVKDRHLDTEWHISFKKKITDISSKGGQLYIVQEGSKRISMFNTKRKNAAVGSFNTQREMTCFMEI